MVWGVFLLTSTEDAYFTSLCTLPSGLLGFLCGVTAFRFTKHGGHMGATIFGAASLWWELFVLLLVCFVDVPFASLTITAIAAAHGVPAVFTGVFFLLVRRAQTKLARELNRRIALQETVQAVGQSGHYDSIARRAQAAIRGHNIRKLTVRRRELEAWSALAVERTLLSVVVYGMLFIVISFCTYINLLYGVMFSTAQARAWVLASLTSFVTDALINAPVILFVRTVISFLRKVLATSFDSVIMGRFAEEAAKAQQSVEEAGKAGGADLLARVLLEQPEHTVRPRGQG
jgi:hypothetical protein